jgi:hypothetical protein
MTKVDPAKEEFEKNHQRLIETKNPKELKKWYEKEKNLKLIIIAGCLFFLCISSFAQLAILDYSFGERLDLSENDKIFGIEIKMILSLLVTAALPISTIVDESGIFGKDKKIKISLWNIQFSPIIWILLPGDMLLTLQAVLVATNEPTSSDPFVPVIAFILATIFSTFAFYLSKSIVAATRIYRSAQKNLQIIIVYDFDPVPLYKEAQQIKLIEDKQEAERQAKQAEKRLQEETVQYQQAFELQQTQYEDKLTTQEVEHSQKVQIFERDLKAYKDHLDSLSELKNKFNQVKKPIVDFITQGKTIFEKFSTIDESIKDFSFPKLEVSTIVNGNTVERPTYYWGCKNSEYSWQEFQLPAELSSVGYSLLNAMEQQKELPPPNVGNYAPREGLSKCLVLGFENYGVMVYCRDEEYRKDGEKWDTQAQLEFKGELGKQQSFHGRCTLEFTPQEIMSKQLKVLEQIKEAINLKTGRESN